jgi:hypothetical protein
MDPNEILKAAPEIVKGVAALGAAIPFTGIVKRMLGPAADEVAQIWADQVRVYRYGRQLKLLEKAEMMAQEAGLTPQAVPPKILFPLLEGASFEDDENLHTMWAALLANAASPDNFNKVRPGFVDALRNMASDEALLLKWISENLELHYVLPHQSSVLPLKALFTDVPIFGPDLTRVRVCLNRLEASCLVTRMDTDRSQSFVFQSENNESNFTSGFPYFITCAGAEFIEACRPPKPKE